MLILNKKQLKQIYCQAETTYPQECCGLLLGKLENQQKTVIQVWQTVNSWGEEDLWQINQLSGNKCNRFAISPSAMLEAQKNARCQNLVIIGIYHSHPDSPPFPSEFDRAIAWSQYSYLIVSVVAGRSKLSKSWIIGDNQEFKPEKVVLLDDISR